MNTLADILPAATVNLTAVEDPWGIVCMVTLADMHADIRLERLAVCVCLVMVKTAVEV